MREKTSIYISNVFDILSVTLNRVFMAGRCENVENGIIKDENEQFIFQ